MIQSGEILSLYFDHSTCQLAAKHCGQMPDHAPLSAKNPLLDNAWQQSNVVLISFLTILKDIVSLHSANKVREVFTLYQYSEALTGNFEFLHSPGRLRSFSIYLYLRCETLQFV